MKQAVPGTATAAKLKAMAAERARLDEMVERARRDAADASEALAKAYGQIASLKDAREADGEAARQERRLLVRGFYAQLDLLKGKMEAAAASQVSCARAACAQPPLAVTSAPPYHPTLPRA